MFYWGATSWYGEKAQGVELESRDTGTSFPALIDLFLETLICVSSYVTEMSSWGFLYRDGGHCTALLTQMAGTRWGRRVGQPWASLHEVGWGPSSVFSNDPLGMKQRQQVTQLGNRDGRDCPSQHTGKLAWIDGTNSPCYEP